MRLFLGLAALAAVNAQTVSHDNTIGSQATVPQVGQTALSGITIGTPVISLQPAFTTVNGFTNSNNFAIYVTNSVSSLVFQFAQNAYVAQLQYRWYPNYQNPATIFPTSGYSIQSYTCDPCADIQHVGTANSCNTATGPGSGQSPTNGFPCALFTRTYTFSNLAASSPSTQVINSFAVQLYDRLQPLPNTSSYSFTIVRNAPPIIGDPQIVGLQGQDFQVHGIPDEIFNMITYPNLQVNARFVYLSSGECHDNFTACFAHPGTYIAEEGIRLGNDKIHIKAGAFKKGLTVSVNGKKVSDKKTAVKLGYVELVNHRRVVVKTPIMAISISNSDKFLNQETTLFDQKLLALGADRRVLGDGENFHSEVPLHGLQGQTWRNVEYPSGLEYEGSISDYHVTDGNLWGANFVFNQYKQ